MTTDEQVRDIIAQIKAEAKRRKLTHGQLSLKWGVTKSYVSVIMRGKRTPSLSLLNHIATVMGVDGTIKIGVQRKYIDMGHYETNELLLQFQNQIRANRLGEK